MRKTILLALPLILAAACSRETEPVSPVTPDEYTMVFHAVAETPDTRTVRMGSGAIYWSPGDVIRIFHGTKSALFTAQTTSDAPNTEFVGSFPADDQEDGPFYALYASNAAEAELSRRSVSFYGTPGYQESVWAAVPSAQAVPAGSFAPGSFPSAAVANGNNLYFENLCGGAVISVRRPGITRIEIHGNQNAKICGGITHYYHYDPSDIPSILPIGNTPNYTVTVTPASGDTFVPGADYYVSLIPAELKSGLTIRYYSNHRSGVFITDKAITISRSKFGRLRGLDEAATWTEETANCLVLKPGETKTFQTRFSPPSASVYQAPARQGPETRATPPVIHIMKTEVLWETLGTAVTPKKGDVVASVSGGNELTIKAGTKEGNAVVALYEDDVLIWSWHVWVTSADLEALAQTCRSGAARAMDRNLGALSATPGDVRALGLMYQWGRKDPFPGPSAIAGTTQAATTLTWPAVKASTSETGTIEYTIAHPTVFISGNSRNKDWYYTGKQATDDTRWNKDKGLYDPCPAGWRVPDRSFWFSALGTSSLSSNYYIPWTGLDETKKGVNLQPWTQTNGTCWYPAAGYLTASGSKMTLSYAGSFGYYWNCEPSSSSSYAYEGSHMYFSKTALYSSTYDERAYGSSVRCIQEKTWNTGDTEDITEEVWDF